jgi:hypothetical protein
MGFDDTERPFISKRAGRQHLQMHTAGCIQTALSQRPDYMALIKQQKISRKRLNT